MQELNSILLERLVQLELEQCLMVETIKGVQRRMDILDKPMPARTDSSDPLASWSKRGLNLRPPEISTWP